MKFKIVKIHETRGGQDKWFFAIKKKVWWGWRFVYHVKGNIEAKEGTMFAKILIFDDENDALKVIENLKYEKTVK